MEQLTFICLPPPPLSFSSSASLNLNVSHYSVAMKTHLTAHLSTSDRCWRIQLYESVSIYCMCVYLIKCVYLFPYCPHESPCRLSGIAVSLLQAGRCYIFMYCVCVSEHTKRQLCHREKSITALGLYSVFPVVMSKENSTFTCHFSFPKWARKKGR